MADEWMELYEQHMFGEMPYRFLRPIDEKADQRYPLVVSLHGAGGKGTDNIKNLRQWTEIFTLEEHRRKYPAYIVAPQTPHRWLLPGTIPETTPEYVASLPDIWSARVQKLLDRGDDLSVGDLGKMFDLVDTIMDTFPIDPDRVYVLGHSMGGFGTWNAICQQPERFAAAIPSAGGCEPWNDIERIVDVPIWAFHGTNDETVPFELTQDSYQRLEKLGGNIKFTQLDGVGHGQDQTFIYSGDNPERGHLTHYASDRCDRTGDVWEWLFAQKRKKS